jgi:thioredoxin 1
MITILENDISICDNEECYLLFYFTAKWCGPCQKIKPLLQKISDGADSSKLKVFMIDIDENDDLAKKFNIRSVPTFYLYKKKEIVGQTGGADIKKVKELIKMMD